MISHAANATPAPLARGTMRRGGPHLFKTIWPEVRAHLAEAAGLERPGPDDGPPGAGAGAPPPWSRAA